MVFRRSNFTVIVDCMRSTSVVFSVQQITKLNISGSSIKGFIAEELFQLSALQELILHDNKLIGSIPMSIGSLKFLKVLDLGKNQLSGPIPSEIRNLVSIVEINLESNGLTGNLPLELSHLPNLQDLRLDRNKLHGTIAANQIVERNISLTCWPTTIRTTRSEIPKAIFTQATNDKLFPQNKNSRVLLIFGGCYVPSAKEVMDIAS
ncbi:hypothetical protein L2E82_24790 [Cichorium intybus]|uniref:Uncharacterized protein n=1 Tax=Cichorium intybus TaxID=13427 RepID=A0ACB9E195_CICIN|nr:hypothetical protein L2E82_24790 [Cichorium intybus]